MRIKFQVSESGLRSFQQDPYGNSALGGRYPRGEANEPTTLGERHSIEVSEKAERRSVRHAGAALQGTVDVAAERWDGWVTTVGMGL
ncbi:hypothetical protein AB0M29_40230 [Streptomyces sp. NPDC051976]|uniref:hypothetical protein n=1 Tax=Streptomyces sp. NPDC051976 TaxID=3154947 RepID=UPI00343EE558